MDDEVKPLKVHQPCPDCGSTDALAVYPTNTFCFSCRKHTMTGDVEIKTSVAGAGQIRTITDRDISAATAKFYNVLTTDKDYVFDYGNAVKYRSIAEKQFKTSTGWNKADHLFGISKFSSGGKAVTITEGEFDAMAAFQMQGSKYPCVSIKGGATAAVKDCQAAYEWLNSFESIVICFDSDKPGREAANKVAELFGGKAKIMRHHPDHKDANDYLMQGQSKRFIEAWWQAEQYRPDGIMNGSDLYDEITKPVAPADCPYPWEGLNKLTYGIRKGELVTITAGSGLGKSQILREIAYHIMKKTQDKIGLMFMEESAKKTGRSMLSLALNKPIHLPNVEVSTDDMQCAFDSVFGGGRFELWSHFGSSDIDNVVNRVRYMAKGLNCQYVFLDHISIIVSGGSEADERKAIDAVMTKLRTLVEETGIALFVVSHLKRVSSGDKGHEDGAEVSLSQLRGSGGIAQLSDMVLALRRDGQHQDPIVRNTTFVSVLKNRYSGDTGQACALLYSKETGRMSEVEEESL
jgi:twinkle protein